MIKVSKSELKAKMLEYFRMVEETGEELIVTSHNIPVIKVTALGTRERCEDIFADIRGKVHIDDSIVEPETEEWGTLT
jgi:prevent-host-death family protein